VCFEVIQSRFTDAGGILDARIGSTGAEEHLGALEPSTGAIGRGRRNWSIVVSIGENYGRGRRGSVEVVAAIAETTASTGAARGLATAAAAAATSAASTVTRVAV